MYKKFNLLDMFFVLLIVVGVFAAISMTSGKNVAAANGNKTVYFTVEIVGLPKGFDEKIKIGDVIKDSTRGYYYGTVDKIEFEPAKALVRDIENQKFLLVPIPEKYTLLLTVKCNGSETDTEILAEGQPIKVGKRLAIKGKGYAGSGYTTVIRVED